jgi:alkylated DNA repair dioxygenase AlkB
MLIKNGNMSLFANDSSTNLLPYDGIVHYYGKVLTHEDANNYFKTLVHSIEWKNDEAMIFGKHIITKRKAAWYGDASFSYTYSKVTKQALPWTTELYFLKQLAQQITGAAYNSCLLNLYHNGDEAMAWHSDDEKTLAKDGAIASISLGAERKFAFKHKRTEETVSILLEHGSLLVMKGTTQTNWLHRLSKSRLVREARINLTFRTIVEQ